MRSTAALVAAACCVAAPANAAKIDAGDVADAKLKTKDFRSEGQEDVGGSVHCPDGTRVLTGGAYWHRKGKPPKPEYNGLSAEMSSSRPSLDGKSWFASGQGEDKFLLTVEVLCSPKKDLKSVAPISVSGFPPDGDPEGGFLSCPVETEVVTGGASWATSSENENPDDSFRSLTASNTVHSTGRAWYADGTDNWIGQPPVLGLFLVARCAPEEQLGKTVIREKSFPANDDEVVGGEAKCPKGSKALTGGGFWHTGDGTPGPDSNEGIFGGSNGFTDESRGWFASGNNFNAGGTGGPRTLTVRVVCLK